VLDAQQARLSKGYEAYKVQKGPSCWGFQGQEIWRPCGADADKQLAASGQTYGAFMGDRTWLGPSIAVALIPERSGTTFSSGFLPWRDNHSLVRREGDQPKPGQQGSKGPRTEGGKP